MFALEMFLIQSEDMAKRRINPLNTIGRHSFITRYRKWFGRSTTLRPEICRARPLPINPTCPSATLENENGLDRSSRENKHAGAGELFSVVAVKTPTINLVRLAWIAPWNVAKARRTT
jgi:hypothetical protein